MEVTSASDSSESRLWPRYDTLSLVLPDLANSGKTLNSDLVFSISAELSRMRTPEGVISYDSWFLVACDKLQWSDACVHIFWDMLRTAVLQIGGSAALRSASVDHAHVEFEYLIIFLALHISDTVPRAHSPTTAYDDVWPMNEGHGGARGGSGGSSSSTEMEEGKGHDNRIKGTVVSPPRMGRMPEIPDGSSPKSRHGLSHHNTSHAHSQGGKLISPPGSPLSPSKSPSKRSSLSGLQSNGHLSLAQATKQLQLLRAKFGTIIRCISTTMELQDTIRQSFGADDMSTNSFGGSSRDGEVECLVSRRSFDKLDLILYGGFNKSEVVPVLSILHPAWNPDILQIEQSSSGGIGIGVDGTSAANCDVDVGLSSESFPTLRLSSSMTIVNDGDAGSLPATGVIEWLESCVGTNDVFASPRSSSPVPFIFDPHNQSSDGVKQQSDTHNDHTSPVMTPAQAQYSNKTTTATMISSPVASSPPVSINTEFSPLNRNNTPLMINEFINSTYIRVMRLMDNGGNEASRPMERESKATVDEGAWGAPESLPQTFITNSWGSTIHDLAPHSFVYISGCSDCKIVLGAVCGAVVVNACERIKVSVVCHKLIVRNSIECKFHLACHSTTAICGDSRGLEFGPLNCNYVSLPIHIAGCGLLFNSAVKNRWDKFYDVDDACRDKTHSSTAHGSPSGYAIDAASHLESPSQVIPSAPSSVAITMEPSSFFVTTIPMEGEHTDYISLESKTGIVVKDSYKKIHRDRLSITKKFATKLIHKAKNGNKNNSSNGSGDEKNVMSQDHTTRLETSLTEKFLEWLLTTGKIKEVMDLIEIEQKEER